MWRERDLVQKKCAHLLDNCNIVMLIWYHYNYNTYNTHTMSAISQTQPFGQVVLVAQCCACLFSCVDMGGCLPEASLWVPPWAEGEACCRAAEEEGRNAAVTVVSHVTQPGKWRSFVSTVCVYMEHVDLQVSRCWAHIGKNGSIYGQRSFDEIDMDVFFSV